MSDCRTQYHLDWVEQKASEALAAEEQQLAETRAELFLPGIDEYMRAMPNHIARSSLFAPIARGKRRMHNDTALTTRKDATIRYWGEQLDEADADIFFQLIKLASEHALGEWVAVNRCGLLRSIGRATGRQNYRWLHARMKSMGAATLYIEVHGKYEIGKTDQLRIVEWKYDDERKVYQVKIDPRWVKMFTNREYALVDWGKRLQIRRGQDMAKALQRLVATTNDRPQRYRVEWLKDKMSYGGRMRDFRKALEHACSELQSLDIISKWEIGLSSKKVELLRVWRPGPHQ